MSSFLERLRNGSIQLHGCEEGVSLKPYSVKCDEAKATKTKKENYKRYMEDKGEDPFQALVSDKPTKKKFIEYIKRRIDELTSISDSE
jgi:hypothetical protein